MDKGEIMKKILSLTFTILTICIQHEIHAMSGLRTYAGRAGQYARQYATSLTDKAIPAYRTFTTQARNRLYNISPHLSQKFQNARSWTQNRNWYQAPRIPAIRTAALGLGGTGLAGAAYLNYLQQEPVRADEHRIFPRLNPHKEYAQQVFDALGFRYDETQSISDNFEELFATALFEKNKNFSEILPVIKQLCEKLSGLGCDIIRKNADLIASLAQQEIETEELKENKDSKKIEMIKNEMADLFIQQIYPERQLRELINSIKSAVTYDAGYQYDKKKLEKYISDFKKYPGLLRALIKYEELDLKNTTSNEAIRNNDLIHTFAQMFNGKYSLYNHDPSDKNLIELLNLLKDEGLTEEQQRKKETELRNNSLWYLYGWRPW